MKKCSIIIASYNEGKNLEKCLESLTQIRYPREAYEIIVVDNNSTDNTFEIVRQFPEVLYLKEGKQGASFARNKGISRAKGNIMVFLDADTAVTRNWLSAIIEPFEKKDIGAVGGAILPFNENNIFSQYLGVSLFLRYPRYGKKREIRGFPSCNLAVQKEMIRRGFDTATFSTYGEDKDICYHILEKGFKVIFQPDAIVYHRHPESLRELIRLCVKSSAGRVDFSKKYPTAPDIVLLNFHFPLIYMAALVFCSFYWGLKGFLFIAAPALICCLYGSIITFVRTGNFLLGFFAKPLLDILSVYAIYGSYHYYNCKQRRQVIKHT